MEVIQITRSASANGSLARDSKNIKKSKAHFCRKETKDETKLKDNVKNSVMSQKIEKTTKKIHIQNAGGEAGRPENKKVIRRIHRYLYHSLSDFHKSSIREVKLKIKHYK